MIPSLLGVYHRLPYPARTAAATLRGLYLRSWRYGPETERLVQQALEREQWSAAQWQRWQEERLATLLHRAATRVPAYREQWSARRRAGDRASWAYLENWPLLEKAELRHHARSFVADDCNLAQLFYEHTSGTTGSPLDLWWSRGTVREWYALFEARWRRWHGVSRRDRWAILGGQLVTPVARRRPPFWVWNAALNQLYMSAYHLAPDLAPHYLDALRRYGVKYLLGYTSSLHALADAAAARGDRDLGLVVAITNAEPLLDGQRQAIVEGLGCPVRETYGMAEIVAAAGECSSGGLHLWPEVGRLEVLQDGAGRDHDGTPADIAGETTATADTVPNAGDLVCTGLLNTDMPLIRYRLGDRAALSASGNGCECGRGLPRLAFVEGRRDDLLYTRDGRRIGRIDPVFKARLRIREAQVIQETLDVIRVRYVAAPGCTAEDGRAIVAALQARMGSVTVRLEEVAAIGRTANGKFRAVICALAPEERDFALRQHATVSVDA